jgi:hypothetical protein
VCVCVWVWVCVRVCARATKADVGAASSVPVQLWSAVSLVPAQCFVYLA